MVPSLLIENPLSSDTGFPSKLPDFNSESNINTKVEKSQEGGDDRDDLVMEKLESLESSDNEEMLFWTQAATELEYCENDEDDPPQRETNEMSKIDESAGKNSSFDLNQAWDTEADDFIDQLLITGAEGETISSSPDPLPDTNAPSKNINISGILPKTSNGIQPDIPTSRQTSTNSMQCTVQNTVCTMTTTDMRNTDSDSDRCPTPPLPLTGQSSLSKQQAHNVRSTLCKSPRRPPSWRLAQEDARSTPPLSPLTGEVLLGKASPLQEIVAPSCQTSLAEVSRGQTLYWKDNSRMPNVAHMCNSETVSILSNAQGSAQNPRKVSPQLENFLSSYQTNNSEVARSLTVKSRDNTRMPSVVQNTRPISSNLSNLHGHAQNADSAVHSASIASSSSGQTWRGHTNVISRQDLSTHTVPQTQNCVREKDSDSPSNKAAILDHQAIKRNYTTATFVGGDHRTLSKPLLQSTVSCNLQHSPAAYRSNNSLDITPRQAKGTFQATPVISVHPVARSAISSLHQCSQAEIEHKRNLARSKLQAKKKASLHNCHH